MSEQQEPRLTTSEEQQQPKEPSAVERFNRAMISGHTISKEADVGISFSAKQLKEHDAAIARKAREDVLRQVGTFGIGKRKDGIACHLVPLGWMDKEFESLRQQQGGQEQPR
jgi:hypothetical protein